MKTKENYYWSDTQKKATSHEILNFKKEIEQFGMTAGEPFLVPESKFEQFKKDLKSGKELPVIGL